MKEFWSICKRLANDERMDVLRTVMCSMGEGLSVNDIADGLRLGQSATSQYLKQLAEECALVKAKREGRYVVYSVAVPAGPWRELIPALREYFRNECAAKTFVNGRRPPAPPFSRILPALANADRIRVVRFLRRKGAASKTDIMSATRLTELNVRRHVDVIAGCGLADLGGTQEIMGKERSSFDNIVWKEPVDQIELLFLAAALG